MGLHTHFSNIESYLNNFYQHKSEARDFDHDGDCEQTSTQDVEFVKAPQLNMLQSVSYLIPQILDRELVIIISFPIPNHIGSDFTLSIFRPPIA